jgi:hypothetical protein
MPAAHRRADGLDDHHFATLLTTHRSSTPFV